MPYFRTLSVPACGFALISVLGSVACGEDGKDTSEGDGSVTDGENGNGGSSAGNNDGENNSGGANGDGGANGNGGTAGGTNGETCGGFAGTACPSGFFCNVEEEVGGAGCFTADGSGVCQAKPQGCPTIYDPVCSCQPRTHASTCAAHSAGQSVLHEGACTTEECEQAGGRVVTSDGASTPMCKTGEIGFDLAGGRETTRCCIEE
jgi:hypothetical protein